MSSNSNSERPANFQPEYIKIQIQVVLEYQWTSSRDLIANVDAEQIVRTSDHTDQSMQVTLRSIIESLAYKGFELEPDQRISFRDSQKSLYVYIGKPSDQALLNTFVLPKEAFNTSADGNCVLTLLIREAGSSLSGQKPVQIRQTSFGVEPAQEEKCRKRLFESTELAQTSQFAKQSHALLASQSLEPGSGTKAAAPESVRIELGSVASSKLQRGQTIESNLTFADQADLKRTKERQIRFVVERVSLWRKLYNGVELGNGETVRYSLEDSAKLVGISKKSLDDYLLQLRFGRMYGFDFLKHQCDNIGVLRKFVREHKSKMKRQQQRQSKEEMQNQTEISHGDEYQGMEETSREEPSQFISVDKV